MHIAFFSLKFIWNVRSSRFALRTHTHTIIKIIQNKYLWSVFSLSPSLPLDQPLILACPFSQFSFAMSMSIHSVLSVFSSQLFFCLIFFYLLWNGGHWLTWKFDSSNLNRNVILFAHTSKHNKTIDLLYSSLLCAMYNVYCIVNKYHSKCERRYEMV